MIKDKIYKHLLYFLSSIMLFLHLFFILVFLVGVVPFIENIYDSMGRENLPLYTKYFVDLSNIVSDNIFLTFLFCLVLFISITIINYFIIQYDKISLNVYIKSSIIIAVISILTLPFTIVILLVITYLPIFNMGEQLLN
tara:strand:+ start:374 stop:790 length:417 start_codon:yes stop_codon:yes gene_type:complete